MCRKYVPDDALLCMDRITYGGGRASGSSPPRKQVRALHLEAS